MDNLHMDSHDGESFFSQIMENQKFRLGAALALGLIVGSGATWATLRTDQPRKPKAVVEQRRVENRDNPVQTNNTANKSASTKKVSLKVALKDCNKIKNKNKKTACIARTKKAYAKRTNSTTKRTSTKPTTTTRQTASSTKPTTTTRPVTATTRSATSVRPVTRTTVKPVTAASSNTHIATASTSPMRVPE